jgi:UDP-N-acetylglucosamine:LPS N-acetylglucosamine transferase
MTTRRFLILSASMGSGHDAVARVLAARLENAGYETVQVDVLELLPGGIGGGLRVAYRAVIERLPVLYAAIYKAFFIRGTVPRPGSAPLAALAESRLLDLTRRHQVDVVVSVFHLAAQIAGRLRASGALPAPSAVVMTEFEPHRQWLHSGNDLYLCHTEEIAADIRRAIGCPAVGNGPLVDAKFADPRVAVPATGAEWWRRRLAPDGRPLVLLSTGAWGIGSSLERTATLLEHAGYAPVILCGQNERLRRRLSALPRITALGWVVDMPALMRAACALVDNAAGQTAMEALSSELPVIGYRPIPGHGADGVRLMADLGLSDYARDEDGLLDSLRRLATAGTARQRRIAAGRAVFRTGAISPLMNLGPRDPDRPLRRRERKARNRLYAGLTRRKSSATSP